MEDGQKKAIDSRWSTGWKKGYTARREQLSLRIKRKKSSGVSLLLTILLTLGQASIIGALVVSVFSNPFSHETSNFPMAFWMLTIPIVVVFVMDGLPFRLFNRFRTGCSLLAAIKDGWFAQDKKWVLWGPWYIHRDGE